MIAASLGASLVAALALIGAAAAPARADDAVGQGAFTDDAAPLPDDPGRPMRTPVALQLADAMTELGGELDAHLSVLSAGILSLRVDGRARRVDVGFHVQTDDVCVRVQGDVVLRGGSAHVRTHLDVGFVGHRWSVDLPDIDLVPRSWDGDRYVEVRVPLVTGSF